MISLGAQAAHRRGIAQRGEQVTFQRISGAAPRTVTFSAVVTAMVTNYQPDGQDPARAGYGASQPGSITPRRPSGHRHDRGSGPGAFPAAGAKE